MSVVVAYVATRLTANAINFQNSLKQFGWMSVRLGADQKWEGWSGRMKLYIEYLKSIDPQQFVILCDADDVLFLRSPDHMNDILMNIDNKILISTESVCSFNCEPVSSYWNRHGEKPKFNQYVNGGGQMGKAFKLLELFTYELETYPADDQIALSRYVNAFPDSVILDSDESVFIIIGPDNLREIDWTDRSFPSLLENNERVRPFLIHLPSFPVEASFSKLFNFDSRHDTYYRALSNRINGKDSVEPHMANHSIKVTSYLLWSLMILSLILIIVLFVLYIRYQRCKHSPSSSTRF